MAYGLGSVNVHILLLYFKTMNGEKGTVILADLARGYNYKIVDLSFSILIHDTTDLRELW